MKTQKQKKQSFIQTMRNLLQQDNIKEESKQFFNVIKKASVPSSR